MGWKDEGVSIKVEVSTSGALIDGTTKNLYPFEGSGTSPPTGWLLYDFTPADGRPAPTLSLSNGVETIRGTLGTHSSGGISRILPVTVGHRYTISVDAKPSTGITATTNGVTLWVYVLNAAGTQIANKSSPNVNLPSGSTPATLSVVLDAIPAAGVNIRIELITNGNGTNGQVWATDWSGLQITDLDPQPITRTWYDLTCDVRELTFKYGRERFTNRYDVSSCNLVLNNNEGMYSYSTTQPIGLEPGRILRAVATYQAVQYPMVYHVIDSIVDGYTMDGRAIVSMTAYDMTSVTSQQTTPAIRPPVHQWPEAWYDTSGERINDLLDYVGILSRAVDPGVFQQQAISSSGRTIRDELGITADSEGGSVFAARDGKIVYKDRTWLTTDPKLMNVQAQLFAMPEELTPSLVVDNIPTVAGAPEVCLNELVSDWSLDRVINHLELANAGGTKKEYDDLESQSARGIRDYQRLDFVNRQTSYLDIRATDIMDGYSDPTLRVNTVGYRPTASSWSWTLAVFLNWLVRIWYVHPTNLWGYAVVTHVQSIEHKIGPNVWEVSMSVDQPLAYTELTLDLSKFGWDLGDWDEELWDQVDAAGALWDNGFKWDAGSKWGK